MRNVPWWIWSAGIIGALMVALGAGNLIEDDGGPLYGRLLFAAVLIGGAVTIAAGARIRLADPTWGSRLIGFGVLPGASGIAFFWFPPAVAVGVLAVVTSVAAFRSANAVATSLRDPIYFVVAATIATTVLAVGLS